MIVVVARSGGIEVNHMSTRALRVHVMLCDDALSWAGRVDTVLPRTNRTFREGKPLSHTCTRTYTEYIRRT